MTSASNSARPGGRRRAARAAAVVLGASVAVMLSTSIAYPESPAKAQPCPGPGGGKVCETALSGPSPRAAARSTAESGSAPEAAPADAIAAVPADAKVSARLRRVMTSVRARRAAGDATETLQDLGTRLVRVKPSGAIHVQVVLAAHRPEHVARLGALGLQVEHVLAEHELVQGWALPSAIEAIAALDFVKRVKPPGYPMREGWAPRTPPATRSSVPPTPAMPSA